MQLLEILSALSVGIALALVPFHPYLATAVMVSAMTLTLFTQKR